MSNSDSQTSNSWCNSVTSLNICRQRCTFVTEPNVMEAVEISPKSEYHSFLDSSRTASDSLPKKQTDEDLKKVFEKITDDNEINLSAFASCAVETAEDFVIKVKQKVMETGWRVCNFHSLPSWLQDNDFLHNWHRPPMPSFCACVRSIFRIHTETANIWTHLLGCVSFIGIATFFLPRFTDDFSSYDKLVFGIFFAGAITCLGFSCAFHTLHCHSKAMASLFSKLDYCGIALLIIGSFVPWLYYGFYCEYYPKIIYLAMVITLGIGAIVVSLWDRFGEPRYRTVRASMFMCFGLSGVVPAVHFLISNGFVKAITEASLGWLFLMALLYIFGAVLYALRVPERFFPGKCDIWFQSHQIFHVLVVAAAFVHLHGISKMAIYRVGIGNCKILDKQNLLSDLYANN